MTAWQDNLKKYNWKCPYPGCVYEAIMYGEASLKTAKSLHLEHHEKNDQLARAEFRKFLPEPKRDYNVLELTAYDKAFLKTRGIKAE